MQVNLTPSTAVPRKYVQSVNTEDADAQTHPILEQGSANCVTDNVTFQVDCCAPMLSQE